MLEKLVGKSVIPFLLIVGGFALAIAVIFVPTLSDIKCSGILNLASLAIGAAAGVTQSSTTGVVQSAPTR